LYNFFVVSKEISSHNGSIFLRGFICLDSSVLIDAFYCALFISDVEFLRLKTAYHKFAIGKFYRISCDLMLSCHEKGVHSNEICILDIKCMEVIGNSIIHKDCLSFLEKLDYFEDYEVYEIRFTKHYKFNNIFNFKNIRDD